MRFLPNFSPKKNETAWSFGLTWSMVGSAIALTYLASCSYIVPDNPRPPRYNTVLGEKRVPPKNQMHNVNPYVAPQMQPQLQPMMRPQSQLTPPSPRAQEQPFVQNTPASNYITAEPTTTPSREEYSWWNPRGWFGDAEPAKPSNTPLRQAPAMNQSPVYSNQMTSTQVPAPMMQPLPSSDGYPSLQNTPPSPLTTGQAQARDKLNYARSDMEAELDAANARAGQLRSDAQLEGSILSQPLPLPPPSVTRPVPQPTNVTAWPEPKVVEPITRTASVSNDITVSEPIQLKAPEGKGQPVQTGVGVTTSMSTMDPSTSTFDPMAGSEEPITLNAPIGTYSGKKYLPESRYITRRTY